MEEMFKCKIDFAFAEPGQTGYWPDVGGFRKIQI